MALFTFLCLIVRKTIVDDWTIAVVVVVAFVTALIAGRLIALLVLHRIDPR